MGIPTSVTIREVGPREGLQTQTGTVPTKDKIEFIDGLTLTGLREIEVTSFVRPDRVPQMADAEDVLKGIEKKKGVRYSALYLNEKGFERAEAAGAQNRGWIYTAASEMFLRKNNNTSHDEVVQSVPAWLKLFGKYEKKVHGVM
ncbi:MAG: hypothetical protein KDD62_06565, partial [Bdellovibrionales bacterium]|nr:hypothetical protein [Bdellovibrionales bacterium]